MQGLEMKDVFEVGPREDMPQSVVAERAGGEEERAGQDGHR
jgi:hypothetical protein